MRKWTARKGLLPEDRIIIKILAETCPQGGQVFLTGEVREDLIGEEEADKLYRYNDTLPEPLFIQTRDMTTRMTRFRPEEVWRCFDPDYLIGYVEEACRRLGIGPIPMEEFDFYRSLMRFLREQKEGKPCIPIATQEQKDMCYQVVYFGALYLFDKPGYMGVPVETHFCLQQTENFLKRIRFRELTGEEAEEYQEVKKDGEHTDALTNKELDFLLALHDSGLFGSPA
jgi:hypothetical protein